MASNGILGAKNNQDESALLDEFNRQEGAQKYNNGQPVTPAWYERGLPMEGRATFLPFKDTQTNSGIRQRELALPGIVAGAVNATTAPGRAYTGSDPNFDAPEEAMNFAGNVMGGGMGASRAMTAPAGTGGKNLGMNIGPSSPAWDAAAHERALNLRYKMGLGLDEVKAITGNEQMPGSGVWSQLMSDKNSRAYPHKFLKLEKEMESTPKSTNLFEAQNYGTLPITEVFHHPAFFKAYPDAKDIRIGRQPGKGAAYMEGSPFEAPTIMVGKEVTKPNDLRSLILHELQHHVQAKEGWPRGGNPEAMMNELRNPNSKSRTNPLTSPFMGIYDNAVLEPKAYKKYNNLEGEAQARATQYGMDFDSTKQRITPTKKRYDVPLNKLDTRYDYAKGGSIVKPIKGGLKSI